MLNRCDFAKWTMMGVVLVSAAALGPKGGRAQDAVVQLQQTMDAADRRISEIVRELARPGMSAERRAALIREKQNQEWARSQAQWAMYKEREERRRSSADVVVPQFQAELIAWQAAAEAWAKEAYNYDSAVSRHNEDVQRHAEAVEDFERHPWRQTQNWAEQLNDWADRIHDNRASLQRWQGEVNRKRAELLSRYRFLEGQLGP